VDVVLLDEVMPKQFVDLNHRLPVDLLLHPAQGQSSTVIQDSESQSKCLLSWHEYSWKPLYKRGSV